MEGSISDGTYFSEFFNSNLNLRKTINTQDFMKALKLFLSNHLV
jgi:hypothetical protein